MNRRLVQLHDLQVALASSLGTLTWMMCFTGIRLPTFVYMVTSVIILYFVGTITVEIATKRRLARTNAALNPESAG